MDYNFFNFHWMQLNGKEILKEGELYYFTGLDHYELNDMKKTVIKVFSLDPSSVISIQNIQQISKEVFELKTGKPFFLDS